MPHDWTSFNGFNKTPRKRLTDRAGRVLSKLPSQDEPMRRFAENIDRDKLCLFLNEKPDKYEFFIKDLMRPENARKTFAYIARKHDVTLHELQQIYSDGMRHLALMNAANAIPDVMADVAEDALSRYVVCTRCDGDGVLVEFDEQGKQKPRRDCPVCDGYGKVREKGDDHSRDILFESAKVTGQKGPLVAIQTNINASDSHLDMRIEGLLKASQAVALPPRRVQKIEETSTSAEVKDV